MPSPLSPPTLGNNVMIIASPVRAGSLLALKAVRASMIMAHVNTQMFLNPLELIAEHLQPEDYDILLLYPDPAPKDVGRFAELMAERRLRVRCVLDTPERLLPWRRIGERHSQIFPGCIFWENGANFATLLPEWAMRIELWCSDAHLCEAHGRTLTEEGKRAQSLAALDDSAEAGKQRLVFLSTGLPSHSGHLGIATVSTHGS